MTIRDDLTTTIPEATPPVQYFCVGPGRFVQYDGDANRAKVLERDALLAERKALLERIATADPGQPTTDAQWIDWAKKHYPYVDHSAEEKRLKEVEVALLATKDK